MRRKALILGSGALGLGFLGPELQPEFDVTLADTAAKEDLLAHISGGGEYRTSVVGPASEVLTVRASDGIRVDHRKEQWGSWFHVTRIRAFGSCC